MKIIISAYVLDVLTYNLMWQLSQLPVCNMSDDFSDDIAERADEIEALSAIFEDSMAVNSDDNSVSHWIGSCTGISPGNLPAYKIPELSQIL